MAASSFLQSKAEAALKVIIDTVTDSANANANCYVGLDGKVDLPLPRIEAAADMGPEFIEATGIHTLHFTVTIMSDADRPLTEHESRGGYVVDAVNTDTLATDLSNAGSNFTCQGIMNRSLPAQRKEARHMISEFSFDGICCASDL